MPEMKSVYSSAVFAIGYDPETLQLHVQWHGKGNKPGRTSIYYDVPPKKAASVMNAPSINSALNMQIKGDHEHGYAD